MNIDSDGKIKHDGVEIGDLNISITNIASTSLGYYFTVEGPDIDLFELRWMKRWSWPYSPLRTGNRFIRSISSD